MTKSWQEALEALPPRVQSDGWLGPTLFTAEARGVGAVTLGAFSPHLRGCRHAESLVIGSVREAHGTTDDVYAAFCVDPVAGQVFLVDLDRPDRACFVNTTVEAFVASLDAFASSWPRLGDGLRTTLQEIDPAAIESDDAFWPTSLVQYSCNSGSTADAD